MYAILGENVTVIKEILAQSRLEHVYIANYNSPRQLVLSGDANQLIKAAEILQNHSLDCIKLNVSGAFHCPLMNDAQLNFIRKIVGFDFKTPQIKVISTTSSKPIDNIYLLELLGAQLTKPVKWIQTIEYLQHQGVEQFVEIGPKNILTKLTTEITQSSQQN